MVDRCKMFKGWTAEKQLSWLNDKKLCLYCCRHSHDQECYAKSRPEYKECELAGCGEHHHMDYHYLVAVNRLFLVHVKPESYVEGTQV